MTVTRPTPDRRRGAILLVVLALLALFAVIGLSFVLYAESEATASRIYREAASKSTPIEVLQRDAAGRALGQLVWGAVDPTSAFRGHDLARLMYGADGSVPYNGVGLYHELLTNIPGIPAPGLDRADAINHTLQKMNPADPTTWVVVDPEYTRADGTVRIGNAGPQRATLTEADTPRLSDTLKLAPFVYIPKNAPYTYPDRNNLLVGAMDPNTGRVFVPSGHRPSLFFAGATADNWFGDPGTNPNWTNAEGRFKILRPRPFDHGGAGSQFPYPPANPDGSVTGDVQNLRYANGVQRNDSVWLDAGLPSQEYKGRRLVPLVAMLLLPLDGRVNLNAAGNLKNGGQHAGNMGFGPWEQNLAAVLQDGATNAQTLVTTKYAPGTDGTNTVATAPGATAVSVTNKPFLPNPAGLPTGPQPPSYSQVDWGGTAAANWLALPGTGAASGLASSPAYTLPNMATDPTNHPTLWNAFQRPQYRPSDPNLAPPAAPVPHAYPLSDLLLFGGRYSGKPFDYQNQTFLANANRDATTPQFGAEFRPTDASAAGQAANRTRGLVTPFSASFAKGSVLPNWFGNQSLTYTAGQPVPALTTPPQLDVATINGLPPATTVPLSDERTRAGQVKVQNLRAALGAVNLNRSLGDYRAETDRPLAATTSTSQPNVQAGSPQYLQAALDRQKLAEDVFIRLAVATGAKVAFDTQMPARTRYTVSGPDAGGLFSGYVLPRSQGATAYEIPLSNGTNLPVTQQEYDALRWLAQLAANVVDYVDNDDINTPFVWNPAADFAAVVDANYTGSFDATTPEAPLNRTVLQNRVVFGTEKPRLVLNEVYAEIANDPSEATGATPPNNEFQVRFFLELLNPNNDETDPAHPLAVPYIAGPLTKYGAVPLQVPGGANPYQVEVYNNDTVAADAGDTIDPTSSKRQRVDNYLRLRAENVTGAAPNNATAKIVAPLNGLAAVGTAGVQADRLEPNNGAPAAFAPNNAVNPPDLAAGRHGITLVGPTFAAAKQMDDVAFVPVDATSMATPTAINPLPATLYQATPGTVPPSTAPPGTPPSATLYYNEPTSSQADLTNKVNPTGTWNTPAARHTVLLRRLANPYLPASPTNPYITVDYQSRVKVYDAVYKTSDAGGGNPRPNPVQPTTIENYRSAGRVQPFAGDESADPDPLPTTYQTTLTVESQLPIPPGPGGTSPKHTFFRHNAASDLSSGTPPVAPGDGSLRVPFRWLAHLDRPLVNPIELLHVPAVRPHELTHRFAVPNSMTIAPGTQPEPVYHRHDLGHPDVPAAAPPQPAGPLFQRGASQEFVSPLYRALDLLQVKPWTHGVPADGRQAGRVNINMLWDGDQATVSRVFQAVLDAQPGNGFTAAEVQTLWQNVVRSRSPQWQLGGAGQVGLTADELPLPTVASALTSYDRPFKGFGTGLFTASAANNVGVTFRTTDPAMDPLSLRLKPPGLADTLLRSLPDVSGTITPNPNGTTGLFQNPLATATHPYQQWEPLRKVMNSFTTTTDTYQLLLTVGFFEVDETNGGRVLKAEAYDQSPGDLRAQFAAVIDRTGLTRVIPTITDTTGLTTDARGRTPNSDGSYGLATDPPELRKAAPGSGPWVLELNRDIPPTAAGTAVPTKLPVPVPQDAGANPNRPQAVVNQFHTGRPDPDTTNFPGFFTVLSAQTPAVETITLADNPTGLRLLYDGVPLTLTAAAQLGVPPGPGRNSGTRFFVGTGDNRELVEAFYDPTLVGAPGAPGAEWSFNPTTGELKLPVRGIDPATGQAGPIRFLHAAGGAATNANFGNPGPQPAKQLRPDQSDPVVRMFAELR